MRTLVLGGNGFIGSHLVDKLLAQGDKVRVLDRYPELYRSPLPKVEYLFGEFGNRGLLTEALAGIDVVFHLISTTLPKTSNDDPAFDVQSNVIESIFLMEKCLEKGVGKVVFLSSGGTVYGIPETLPVPETHSMAPISSYGISKIMIEKYFALFKHLHGLDYNVLRLSNPYGARQNPAGIQGAIPVFLGKVAKGEPIQIWGNGEVVRDYVFIDDVIEGIYRAAAIGTSSAVLNLGSGTGYSLNTIVHTIGKVVGREPEVVYGSERAFDVPAIYLDITRARQELGWHPAVTLETGIGKTWEFISNLNI